MKKRAVPQSRDIKFKNALKALEMELSHLVIDGDITLPVAAQCAHWHKVRKHYEAIRDIANKYETLSREWSYDHLPEAFRKEQIRNLTLDGVGQFALGFRTTARVHDWSRANGFLKQH